MEDLKYAILDQDDAPIPEGFDEYIGIHVLLTRGEGCQWATINHWKQYK